MRSLLVLSACTTRVRRCALVVSNAFENTKGNTLAHGSRNMSVRLASILVERKCRNAHQPRVRLAPIRVSKGCECNGDVSTVICAGRLESGLATKLFVPQSLNGVQARGTDGRYHAADQSYGTEDNRCHDQRAGSNDQADIARFRVLRHGAV